MIKWHERPVARLCLRLSGAVALWRAWLFVSALYVEVHAHPPRPASLGELGACAAVVTLVLVGNALLFVGPALFRQVEIPRRWHGTSVAEGLQTAAL
ncbi:hypothetical protein [Novosphingobium sp. ZW T3_23]|uniref:hypothetical protein n=1 Tax=Novosphingobium sp. ZW T3_23 TaxID=3378084 RepID=UPI0038530D71